MQRMFRKRGGIYTFVSPRVRSDPLRSLGPDVTRDQSEGSELTLVFARTPLLRILAIVLRSCVRSHHKSSLPQAPAHGGDSVKGLLIL